MKNIVIELGEYKETACVSDNYTITKERFIQEIIDEVHEEEMMRYPEKPAEWRLNRLSKLEDKLMKKELKIKQL